MAAEAPWAEVGTGFASLPGSKRNLERFEVSLGELTEGDEPAEDGEIHDGEKRPPMMPPLHACITERFVPEHLRRLSRPDVLPTIASIASISGIAQGSADILHSASKTFSDQLSLYHTRRRPSDAELKGSRSEGLASSSGLRIDDSRRNIRHTRSTPLSSLRPQVQKLLTRVVRHWAAGASRSVTSLVGAPRHSQDSANSSCPVSAARASFPTEMRTSVAAGANASAPSRGACTADEYALQEALSIPWEDSSA